MQSYHQVKSHHHMQWHHQMQVYLVQHLITSPSRCRFLSFQLHLEIPRSDLKLHSWVFSFVFFYFWFLDCRLSSAKARSHFGLLRVLCCHIQLSKSFYGPSVLFSVLPFGIIVCSLACLFPVFQDFLNFRIPFTWCISFCLWIVRMVSSSIHKEASLSRINVIAYDSYESIWTFEMYFSHWIFLIPCHVTILRWLMMMMMMMTTCSFVIADLLRI